MKKWEEQRKKKLYAEKISNAKPTLKTQPKGTKVLTAQYSGRNNIGYGPDSEMDMQSHYVSNELASSQNQFPGMHSTHYT
jgi:hypothetical protein